MEKIGKTWFCPKCKNYPGKIHETTKIFQERQWADDMDTYELMDDFRDEEVLSNTCAVCSTELIEKFNKSGQ